MNGVVFSYVFFARITVHDVRKSFMCPVVFDCPLQMFVRLRNRDPGMRTDQEQALLNRDGKNDLERTAEIWGRGIAGTSWNIDLSMFSILTRVPST